MDGDTPSVPDKAAEAAARKPALKERKKRQIKFIED
jgi:hypothetical protein